MQKCFDMDETCEGVMMYPVSRSCRKTYPKLGFGISILDICLKCVCKREREGGGRVGAEG